VGGRQGLGREAGVFALDVEEADLAEVEKPLVKVSPVRHAPAVDVVRQMIDELEAVTWGMTIRAPLNKLKVNVVDGFAVFKAINQIQRRAANALDGGQVQLHRPGGYFNRLRPQFQGALIGVVRVFDTKR